jgi:hypothetical protein
MKDKESEGDRFSGDVQLQTERAGLGWGWREGVAGKIDSNEVARTR